MSEKLSKQEVAEMLREHDKIGDEIDRLHSEQDAIINDICRANGACKQCLNWHYPYCGGLR